MKKQKYEWKVYGYCFQCGLGSCEHLKNNKGDKEYYRRLSKTFGKSLFNKNR